MPGHQHTSGEVLAAAAALVAGFRGKPVEKTETLTVTIEARDVTLRARKWPGEEVPTVPAERGFSPAEKAVLQALAGGEWKTAARIAEGCGEEHGARFGYLLTNLVECGVLESCQRRGYRLTGACATEGQ